MHGTQQKKKQKSKKRKNLSVELHNLSMMYTQLTNTGQFQFDSTFILQFVFF